MRNIFDINDSVIPLQICIILFCCLIFLSALFMLLINIRITLFFHYLLYGFDILSLLTIFVVFKWYISVLLNMMMYLLMRYLEKDIEKEVGKAMRQGISGSKLSKQNKEKNEFLNLSEAEKTLFETQYTKKSNRINYPIVYIISMLFAAGLKILF